jgi:hypothetical protein
MVGGLGRRPRCGNIREVSKPPLAENMAEVSPRLRLVEGGGRAKDVVHLAIESSRPLAIPPMYFLTFRLARQFIMRLFHEYSLFVYRPSLHVNLQPRLARYQRQHCHASGMDGRGGTTASNPTWRNRAGPVRLCMVTSSGMGMASASCRLICGDPPGSVRDSSTNPCSSSEMNVPNSSAHTPNAT